MDEATELLIFAQARDLGGLTVARVLPDARCRMVGPFVFFDHIGPREIAAGTPSSIDVRAHPHIGLATITYLFAGEITHRDSLGYHQPIRPGEVNWMTAGRGISHSERFERLREQGGLLHGIQAWVALPQADEECAPRFEHFGREELARVDRQGAALTVIAGSAFGASSGVRTSSRLFYVHAQLNAGAELDLPADYSERAVYVVDGAILCAGKEIASAQMAIHKHAQAVRIRATLPSSLMLLGGDSVGERVVWWNFVSSRRERIEQAKLDWASARIPLPPDDADEFIALPKSPAARPEPAS